MKTAFRDMILAGDRAGIEDLTHAALAGGTSVATIING